MVRTKISGLGKCLPTRVVKNNDFTQWMETSDEWIRERSGIEERRWAEPGGLTGAQMGAEAGRMALKNAGKTIDDVDMIIFATLHADRVFPGDGVEVQSLLCPDRFIPALDIRNQCSGFLYSLSVADAWIRSGMYKSILIIGSEVHSTSLDLSTKGRDISVLFGDGAGAALVEATSEPGQGVMNVVLHSEGRHADKLCLKKPTTSDFPRISQKLLDDPQMYPQMDGRFVFKNAVTRMCEALNESAAKEKVKISDIDFVIAHQANLRINQMVLSQMGIPESKSFNTMMRYGNTTAATIPLTMCEAIENNKIKRGDLVALVAFGSGFTWGASLLRY